MNFCIKELIYISGIPERTFYRRLLEIKTKKLFEKKTIGKNYTYDEALEISIIIGFKENFTNHTIKKPAK